MTTENNSMEVVEPTLATVRAEREAAEAKAKEEQRVRAKTSALQNLDGFVIDAMSEIERLDAEVKRSAERRKKLEEAIAVAKSIDTNANVTAEEIREITQKAADVFYGRKGDDALASRAIGDEMIYLMEPRRFHRGGVFALDASALYRNAG